NYRSRYSPRQAENLAAKTIAAAEHTAAKGQGGKSEDSRGTTYEAKITGTVAHMTTGSLGSRGEDFNRVGTVPLERITDPNMLASVAERMAQPDMVSTIAIAQERYGGAGPIEIQVIVTQY